MPDNIANDLPDTNTLALPGEVDNDSEQHEDAGESEVDNSNNDSRGSEEDGSRHDDDINELDLPDEDNVEERKKSLPKWLEKKISKKDREIAARAAESEALRVENQRLKEISESGKSHENMRNDYSEVPPKRDDFDDEDEYIDARFDYRERKKSYQQQINNDHQRMVEAENNFNKNLNKTVDKGSEKYNDFEEKVSILFTPQFPSNRAMAEAIFSGSHSEDISYFLATYPDHAIKIAQSNPIKAIEEITKIRMRFEAKNKVSVTKATSPVVPLKGGSSAGVVEGNPEKMSQQDFEDWYKRKVKSK